MRNSLMTVGVIVTALSVAPACATKKFVRTSVGEVNDKVTSQGKTIEETQERVRVAEGRITEVDAKKNKVTLRDAEGKTRTVEVEDPGMREKLSTFKPGDNVEVTYTEAVAASLVPVSKK